MWRLHDKRAMVQALVEEHTLSDRQACAAMQLDRSTAQHIKPAPFYMILVEGLDQYIQETSYDRCMAMMGHLWTFKRVYTAMGFNVRLRVA